MYHDDLQYDKSRFTALAWNQRLRESLPTLVKEIADRFGITSEYEYLSLGSFNCCYRLKGLHAIVRFPILSKSTFRHEKTNDECMIMTYISQYTSIPVPKLLAAESYDLGPYMVLSFVDATRLSDHLKAQSDPLAPIILQPDIDTTILARAYRNMARNDAIDDEADCRKKYVVRYLFLKIARNFWTATYDHGPFPLYCDDFRPTNIIVESELNISGVIDWEYCYAAPVELTYCSPWWLLLKHPDNWTDLRSFLEEHLPRHKLFIQVLQDEEHEMIQRGDISERQRLSVGMAQSLENGHFWFCLAATSSYGFDEIYWEFIDPLYYGEFTSIEDRIGLLSK
ncbi:hypothetical protein B7463_g3313, partial [Scytalidium lignicola]